MGKQLTPKQQQATSLRNEGKSVAQIAKLMGITVNGVYGHLRKAKSAPNGGVTNSPVLAKASQGATGFTTYTITGTSESPSVAHTIANQIRARIADLEAESACLGAALEALKA